MLARVRAVLAIVASLLLGACDRSPTRGGVTKDAPPAPARSPAQPAASPPTAPASAPAQPAAAPDPSAAFRASGARPAAHSCAVAARAELGPGERVLAGYGAGAMLFLRVEEGGRGFALYGAAAGQPLVRRANHALDARAQRLAWACGDRGCELALVDEKARLLAFRLERDRVHALGVLASGVDRRFAPAVAQHGERALYAYTSTIDEAMHTSLVVRSGSKAGAPRDLTPAGHGAAAPTFVLGAARPTLIAIDARAGLSPLLEFDLGDPAAPAPARVGTPVSAPYAPPWLGAVRYPSGEVEVFYTVIGRAAMTAIGRVPLRRPVEPTPLVPSRGYGELQLSVTLADGYALIAAEQPSAAAAAAKRTLLLELTDGTSTHDALVIDEGGEAARPSLAAMGDDEFLLGYVSAGRVHAALLRCTP